MRKSPSGYNGQIELLQARIRHLEARLAHYEPEPSLCLNDLLSRSQRMLTPEEVEYETQRLLPVCARDGVAAVVKEVVSCRDLLLSLANACHRTNLTEAGQYLNYLACPYD